MTQEFETKLLKGNADEMETKLISLGAKKIFDQKILALVYDTPDKRLFKEHKALRLRMYSDGTGYITTKHKVSSSDDAVVVNTEPEFSPDDLEQTHQSYQILGFIAYGPIIKHRVSYAYEGIRFEFDKYENSIPRFVEVEGTTQEEVQRGVELLGFTMEDTDNRNMHQLFQDNDIALQEYKDSKLPLLT